MEIGYGHEECVLLVEKPDLLLNIRAALRRNSSRGKSPSKCESIECSSIILLLIKDNTNTETSFEMLPSVTLPSL